MDEKRRRRADAEHTAHDAPQQETDGKVTLRINLLKVWQFIALIACLLAAVFCILWLQAKKDARPEELEPEQTVVEQQDTLPEASDAEPAAEQAADAQDYDVSGVSIAGKRIIIDPGHGGNVAGGTTGVSGRAEKEINLEIALKLRDMLEENGATVIMTRETDASLSPTDNWEEDMQAREAIIAQSNADMFISIHQNEFENPEARGPQVFFVKQGSIGKRLAVCIQDMMNYELEIENPRIALEAAYRLLKTGEQPSCIVECGFLSNPEEDLLLQDDAYQNKVAKSIMDGIKLYVKTYG